jgi:hypothetical protein
MKLTAGIALGLVYFNYYKSGDTLVFHEVTSNISVLYDWNGKEYLSFLVKGPGNDLSATYPILNEPRSTFFIKILSFFYLLTSNNYWITSIYLSLLSFWGSWLLADTIIKLDKNMRGPTLIGLLYMPSFIFWTSGVLKEAIAWYCISMLAYYYLNYRKNKFASLRYIVVSVILVYVLWGIKYYYVAVLILCFVPLLIYQVIPGYLKKGKRFYTLFLGIYLALGITLSISHSNFHPGRIFPLIFENHKTIIQMSDPGQFIDFIKEDNPYIHFLINLPISLIGGLFMPLFWQGANIFTKITGVLNTILLIFFIGKVFSLFKTGFRSVSIQGYFMAFYILILAILLAYTTPNFGTLERYKVSYISFFIIWVLHDNPFFQRVFR